MNETQARIRALAADPAGDELVSFLPALNRRLAGGPLADAGARCAGGTFVACLEMAKQGEIDADQDSLFDPIRINRSHLLSRTARAS